MSLGKTAALGFYTINGTSVLRSIKSLHKKRSVKGFKSIRKQNPAGFYSS